MTRTITPVPLHFSDDELRARFAALRTRKDVATLLGTTDKELIYLLYRDGKKYIEFDVPKKSGGARHLAAPTSSIKIIQKRLNQVLQAVYRPKAPVFGFARNRSIIGNADRHINKRLLLNIDLKDFFPTIHFGRVRGVFVSYGLPIGVSQVLAQICCHEQKLPQGAPTSPVISNMVCAGLDSALRGLAAQFACTYTRYADDITFSTTRHRFPAALVVVSNDNRGKRRIALGDDLLSVFASHSFEVNFEKIRVRTLAERREVTGLIVHHGVNVPREFVRSVRGMLHAWEKYGYRLAEAELRARHHRKHRRPGAPPVSLRDVAAGKLEFIRAVRGGNNLLYTRLWNRFVALAGAPFTLRSALVQTPDQIDTALWILESEDGTVGTAFALDTCGLVSCAHCIGRGVVVAYQPGPAPIHHRVTVTHRCDERDLVRLKLDVPYAAAMRIGAPAEVRVGAATVVAGFGNYAPGSTSRLIRGRITGMGVRSAIPVFYSDHRAFGGHSGGPVLDPSLRVIGVLQRAVTPDTPGQETTILKIDLLGDIPVVAASDDAAP